MADPKPLWSEKEQELLNKLRIIRERKEEDFKPLPPSKYLRKEVRNLEGELVPFTFRYYQVQGILNMLAVTRFVLGDGTGLGKTAQTIGTLCYLLEKSPDMKIVVVAPKSAIRQWKSEVERFTDGIEVHLATAPKGGKNTEESAVAARQRVYEAWLNSTKPSVLILNYAILIRDWNHGGFQPLLPNGKPDIHKPVIPGLLDKMMKEKGSNLTVVFDEATAFKSRRTKTWEVVQFFSGYSKRVYALTATKP